MLRFPSRPVAPHYLNEPVAYGSTEVDRFKRRPQARESMIRRGRCTGRAELGFGVPPKLTVVRCLTITRRKAGAFTALLSLKHVAKRTYTLRISAKDPQARSRPSSAARCGSSDE
jgi:hypothetical protein